MRSRAFVDGPMDGSTNYPFERRSVSETQSTTAAAALEYKPMSPMTSWSNCTSKEEALITAIVCDDMIDGTKPHYHSLPCSFHLTKIQPKIIKKIERKNRLPKSLITITIEKSIGIIQLFH